MLVSFNTPGLMGITSQAELVEDDRSLPVMLADTYFLQRYEHDYATEEVAYIDPTLLGKTRMTSDFSLLDLLYYVPAERTQGYCSNCWMWPSTSIVELALRVQEGVTENRLSVQYMNTCGELYPTTQIGCCEGGTLSMLASFYRLTGIAIPWSNTNAYWQDYVLLGQCQQCECDEIAKEPNYPISDIKSKSIPTHGVSEQTAIDNIKNILHQNRGVYFAVFYADEADIDNFRYFWKNQNENTVYDLDYYAGHPWIEEEAVGHAMLIVGYHDDENSNDSDYWILLNSWGVNSYRPNGLLRIDMHMDYSMKYVNSTQYAFGAETLNVTFGSAAPTTSITGPTHRKLNRNFTFDVSAMDPQGDDVYLSVDWGDGSSTTWLGPYNSGQVVQVSHTFPEKVNYTIKAKAKDVVGHEGKMQPLLLVYKPIIDFLEWVWERFPLAFPVLRFLLKY